MHFFQLSSNWIFKAELGNHLRDKHGHRFLWDLELFCPSFKVGQTKDENMHFCWLSQNWNFKAYLDTHLRAKHGHLFWWDLQLFWRSFKVGQRNVENMHFCRISRNWVLKVDLGTHLREAWTPIFMTFGAILVLVQAWSKQGWKNALFLLFWNSVLKVDLGTHLRDEHGNYFYEIWSYFGPCSRLVNTRFKICTFVDILRIEFWKWI